MFLAFVCLAGWFVTRPLRGWSEPPAEDLDVVAFEAARDAKLRELRDAELDFATGKLEADDFTAIDGALRAETADLLRRLDRAQSEAQ